MLIGILSDSHGRAETTRQAVLALRNRGIGLAIHLGDVGSDAVIEELIPIPSRMVFGNCDDDISGMSRYALIMGIAVDHPMGMMETDGRRIAFTHGHLPDLLNQALTDGVDYLLHGHTHELRDERIGKTRVINPGALFRANRYTAAVLDPATDRLEIIELSKS